MRQKMREMIDSGSDIEFSLNGIMYTILPWTDNGIMIGPQGPNGDEFFDSADDLIDGYRINGVPLAMLLDQIVITFSS